jgi:rhodanese-related sulfurtransferase
LDWAAAEVHDHELSVPLSGEPAKGFKQAFRHTVRLLGAHAEWGEVEIHRGAVQVADVRSGSEETLRHHLESIVTQVNATLRQDAEETAGAQAPQGPDAEMTERFRSFAAAADRAQGEPSR